VGAIASLNTWFQPSSDCVVELDPEPAAQGREILRSLDLATLVAFIGNASKEKR
jgi:hypothetical protein